MHAFETSTLGSFSVRNGCCVWRWIWLVKWSDGRQTCGRHRRRLLFFSGSEILIFLPFPVLSSPFYSSSFSYLSLLSFPLPLPRNAPPLKMARESGGALWL